MRGLFQLRAPRPPSRKASFVDSFGSHEGFTFGLHGIVSVVPEELVFEAGEYSGEVSRSSDDYVIILILAPVNTARLMQWVRHIL